MIFTSPTWGKMTLEGAFGHIISYVNEQPNEQYKLIIGTDSHAYYEKEIIFVTAIIIHRVGKGGRYFSPRKQRYLESLRQRIFLKPP